MAGFQTLSKRIQSAVAMGSLVALILYFSEGWSFRLATAVVTALALEEFYSLLDRKKATAHKIMGICVVCAALVIVPDQWHLVIPLVVALVFLSEFFHRTEVRVVNTVSTTLFGIVYLAVPMAFMVYIRELRSEQLPDTRLLVLFLIFSCKTGDIAAYICGTLAGRHLLIPRISPNKSIEGTACGLVTSVLAAVLCGILIPAFGMKHSVILGLIIGVLGVFGDLTESLLKRDCRAKDSGFTIPGYGGILDVVDSLIFATPAFYVYLKVVFT